MFSVAGGRARNQNFTLDGGNVSNAVGLTRPQQLTSLPVDAMQEFRVIANNYSAEFGHSTGGVDHDVHALGHQPVSRQPVRIAAEQRLQRAQLLRRHAAADPAEPVRRHRSADPSARRRRFFFVTWEHTGQLTSDTTTSTVPTLLNRAGDFSDLRSTAGKPVLIYDPATTVGHDAPAVRRQS